MKFTLIVDPAKEEEVVVTVHAASELTDKIRQLVEEAAGTERIAAFCDDEIRMLPYDHIVCITVIDGKSFAIDYNGKQYRLRQRLYELEAMVPASFIRINKSSIANETRIERFAANFSGAVDVIFQGGYREYVSRRCFAEIKRRYRL